MGRAPKSHAASVVTPPGPLAGLLTSDPEAEWTIACSGGEKIGRQRFRADVGAAAARLQALGCRRGLVACDDTYWAAVGLFALAHTGAESLLLPNALPATLATLQGSFDHIVTDGQVESISAVKLAPASGGPAALPAMAAADARMTLFTSGSTGAPKRITKTLRQMDIEAQAIEAVLGGAVPVGAPVHATVVHQHLYGMSFRLLWPLATRRVVIGETHRFWEPLLHSLQADAVLVTSPSHLTRLDGLPPLSSGRRPSAVLSAGAPLPSDAAFAARTMLGCPVTEFFGSTEAGVVASRSWKQGDEPAWRALPGVTVSRTEEGRIHVRSPYLDQPDGEVGADLVDIDADGSFRLLGRGDRVAKIEGIRVSLAEIEARLADAEGVAACAVVVVQQRSPYLGAVVVLDGAGERERMTAGPFRLGRRLRRALAQSLPLAALPRRWRFVSRLPSGPLGKIQDADLAGLFDGP
jgi:acyl-coenzyme A synthetase/AMP-(fatty) acid ligase